MWGVLFFMFGTGFGVCCACRTVPQRLRLCRGRCGHRFLRTRLQIGRRGDYQSPTGSRVQGSIPNAPTVGRGAHTPPLPGWCNHRGTGRTWYRGGMWACRPTPAAVVRVLCTRGRAAASRPYDGHPGGLGAAGIAGLFGRIVWYNTYFAAQKRGCLEKETASVQFIPLR